MIDSERLSSLDRLDPRSGSRIPLLISHPPSLISDCFAFGLGALESHDSRSREQCLNMTIAAAACWNAPTRIRIRLWLLLRVWLRRLQQLCAATDSLEPRQAIV